MGYYVDCYYICNHEDIIEYLHDYGWDYISINYLCVILLAFAIYFNTRIKSRFKKKPRDDAVNYNYIDIKDK